MAAGDKVIFPSIKLTLLLAVNSRALGGLPLIGTVVSVPSVDHSRVVWPGGVDNASVPDECLMKVYPLSAFADPAAAAWGDDIGKYVQLTDWPYAGAKQQLQSIGTETPPMSPAASGIVQRVLAVNELNNEAGEPNLIISYIAVQDGRRVMVAIGSSTTAFVKPYTVQNGRRAVGYG